MSILENEGSELEKASELVEKQDDIKKRVESAMLEIQPVLDNYELAVTAQIACLDCGGSRIVAKPLFADTKQDKTQ